VVEYLGVGARLERVWIGSQRHQLPDRRRFQHLGNGDVAFIPPMDSVGEFRVTSNAYDAAIERSASATIDLTVKAGGKSFHGSVYEFNQTNMLNAIPSNNGLKNGVVPPVHLNEYGATIGGPIWIPKVFDGRKRATFFFFSYDGIRNDSPGNSGYMSLPTLAERAGDFSKSFTTSGGVIYPVQIYDPLTINPATGVRQLINNGSEIIPADRISPVAKAIYALLPAPDNAGDGANSDSNNYLKRENKTDKFNSYIARFDNALSENHHTYLELRKNRLDEVSGDPFGPTNILDSQILIHPNDGLTIDHSWVVGPSFLLDFHGNATFYQSGNLSLSYGVNPAAFGFSSAVATLSSTPSIPALTGIGAGYEQGGYGTTESPNYSHDALYEGRVTATHIIRNHSVKYGGGYLIQQEADGNLGAVNGTFAFGNNWTTLSNQGAQPVGSSSSIADIAAFDPGLPTSDSLPNNASAFWSQPYIGFFVQDDWRATSRLTLNFGLRWDEQLGLTERHNRFFGVFNPATPIPGITNVAQPAYAALIAGSSTNPGVQYLQKYRSDPSTFVARGTISYAGVNGTSRDVTGTTGKYFQPRIGFAYRIHANTVIRGGFGRFVEANFVTGHANQTGYSTSTPFTATNDNFVTTASTLNSPFANTVPVTGNAGGPFTSAGSFSSFYQPQIPRQYNDEISLHLQQQEGQRRFELGGTLNMTHGLGIGYDVNQPSFAAWTAANTPVFDSTGKPGITLPGNVQVANPFLKSPYITNSLQTSTTIGAYQLSRPNPLLGTLTENIYNGKNVYYAEQSKVQRRYNNGLALLGTFTWSKDMSITTLPQPQPVSQKLLKQLSSGDQRFLFNLNPTYLLPIGRGQYFFSHIDRWTDLLVGGWQLSGIFTYNSGTPVNLPTNSAFFEGGDPGAGFQKTRQKQFDTMKFAPFPTISTSVTDLNNTAKYPAWTHVLSYPGAGYINPSPTDATKNGVYQDFATWQTRNPTYFGSVRNPALVNLDIGLRKDFPIHEQFKVELRFDAFNALNHPLFSGPRTSASSSYFGYLSGSNKLSQNNAPRAVQLTGNIYF
jgi:hypothetical protein